MKANVIEAIYFLFSGHEWIEKLEYRPAMLLMPNPKLYISYHSIWNANE